MSHISIVINAQTPGSQPAQLGASTTYVPPAHQVSVSYVPADTMTPAQIGQEVARIQRHVNQIIDVSTD